MQCNRKRIRRDNQNVTGIQRKQLPLWGEAEKFSGKGGREMGVNA